MSATTIETTLDTLTIMLAQPDDLAAVMAILAEAAQRLQTRGIQQWAFPPPPGLAARMASEIRGGFVYLVRRQTNNAGVATFRLHLQDDYWPNDGLAGYVHSLALCNSAQGHGVGHALLGWVQEQLRGQQRHYLRLDCMADNGALRHYYEAQGFVYRGDVVDDEYKLARYELALSLQQAKRKGNRMQRYGQVLGIKPENLAEYSRLHAAVWPEVLKTIHACNIRNYSIFHKDNLLFAYFEYIGTDFAGDMAKMAADPITQEWWSVCIPLQDPLPTRAEGEWWANMNELFHTE